MLNIYAAKNRFVSDLLLLVNRLILFFIAVQAVDFNDSKGGANKLNPPAILLDLGTNLMMYLAALLVATNVA